MFFCRRVCTAWYAVCRQSINSILQVTRTLSPRDWFETFTCEYDQTPANHIYVFVLFLNDLLGRGVSSQIGRSCLQFADTWNKSVTHAVCVQEIFPLSQIRTVGLLKCGTPLSHWLVVLFSVWQQTTERDERRRGQDVCMQCEMYLCLRFYLRCTFISSVRVCFPVSRHLLKWL